MATSTKIEDRLTAEMPFVVPLHDWLLARVAGKDGASVLTVEMQLYNAKICEYTEPLFYPRFWCYPTADAAFAALIDFLSDDSVAEPQGWQRSVDLEHGVRRGAWHDGLGAGAANDHD